MFVRRLTFDWHTLSVEDDACFAEWLSMLPEEHRDWRTPMQSLSRNLMASCMEYVYLQNPLAQFDARRPQLPNQRYPGLGIGKQFLQMIQSAAKRHGRDLIINRPEAFHNALMYNRHGLRYLSPHCQAYFELMLEDLGPAIEADFAGVSWAVYEGRLRFRGKPCKWPMWDQVSPVAESLARFIHDSEPLIQQLKRLTRELSPAQPLFTIASPA